MGELARDLLDVRRAVEHHAAVDTVEHVLVTDVEGIAARTAHDGGQAADLLQGHGIVTAAEDQGERQLLLGVEVVTNEVRRLAAGDDPTLGTHATVLVHRYRDVIVAIGHAQLEVLDAVELDTIEIHRVVAGARGQAHALQAQEHVEQQLAGVLIDLLGETSTVRGQTRRHAVDDMGRIGGALLVVHDDLVAGVLHSVATDDGQAALDVAHIEHRRRHEGKRWRVDGHRRRLHQLLAGDDAPFAVADEEVLDLHHHGVEVRDGEVEEQEGHLARDLRQRDLAEDDVALRRAEAAERPWRTRGREQVDAADGRLRRIEVRDVPLDGLEPGAGLVDQRLDRTGLLHQVHEGAVDVEEVEQEAKERQVLLEGIAEILNDLRVVL